MEPSKYWLQIADDFDAAASRLTDGRWRQSRLGDFDRIDAPVCALGALVAVTDTADRANQLRAVAEKLMRVNLPGWNDMEGRTADDVIRRLHMLAEQAREMA